ncbi:MAG: histidine phosphatase family protein [Firmicutes bacterium]|nr:histidine phosphatase family protein [Bacillota bacterium]
MASKILFLRHGITEGNKNRWFYGGLNLHLLPEGIENLNQKKASGYYPEIPDNAQYFTTGLIRTEETLETLFGKKVHETIPELREMEFGEYEGRTFQDLENDPLFQNWTYDETGDVAFPGGETRNQFAQRIIQGKEILLGKHKLKELEVRHNGKDAFTVMICHGGVIASLIHDMFPGERESMWDWITEPGGGYLVEMGPHGPMTNKQLGDIIYYYPREDE